MNREEILRMAREQGLPETEVEGVFRVNSDDLGRLLAAGRERFVEAAMKSAEKAVEVAITLEREACAKVCEDMSGPIEVFNPKYVHYIDCAAAIRARGEQ